MLKMRIGLALAIALASTPAFAHHIDGRMLPTTPIAGLLSGLFGVGGGVIVVPALMAFLHLDQRRASATSLVAIAPAAVARDDGGRLVTDGSFETAMRGLWAIGAVRAGYSGLLRDAAAEAQRAAQAVAERLA